MQQGAGVRALPGASKQGGGEEHRSSNGKHSRSIAGRDKGVQVTGPGRRTGDPSLTPTHPVLLFHAITSSSSFSPVFLPPGPTCNVLQLSPPSGLLTALPGAGHPSRPTDAWPAPLRKIISHFLFLGSLAFLCPHQPLLTKTRPTKSWRLLQCRQSKSLASLLFLC